MMFVGFAHHPNKKCFNISFRVEVWAMIEGVFDGFSEEFSSVKSFADAEFCNAR